MRASDLERQVYLHCGVRQLRRYRRRLLGPGLEQRYRLPSTVLDIILDYLNWEVPQSLSECLRWDSGDQ